MTRGALHLKIHRKLEKLMKHCNLTGKFRISTKTKFLLIKTCHQHERETLLQLITPVTL